MLTSDFDFIYPEELVATRPQRPSRILLAGSTPKEIHKEELFQLFQKDDVLVVNETKVIPKKFMVTTAKGKTIDVLFLNEVEKNIWTVLLPVSRLQRGEVLELPDDVNLEIIAAGMPQTARVSKKIDIDYFQKNGAMPLPPYIERARKQQGLEAYHDQDWYQTAWAEAAGSAAAPTASFHFSEQDLLELQKQGVVVEKICLHVGLGTFLPVQAEKITEHKMHSEAAYVSAETWKKIVQAKNSGKRVWALGTTVCRSLESIPKQKLRSRTDGSYQGETDIFIYPGFDFEVVSGLLTNFHQPKSTLLALVAAFAGDLDVVKKNYQWAVDHRFRLFSYGDLSVWLK